MIAHICEGSEDVCFNSFDEQSKYPAPHNGPGPAEVFELILYELWAKIADFIVVSLYIVHFLMNLHQEGRPDQFYQVFVGVVYGKSAEISRQEVEIQEPFRIYSFGPLLQEEHCQESVFG